MDRKECANTAITAAMACLNMVLEEQDVRDAIVGVPIFTHTMVTFSAVFLLKVAVNWNSAYLNIDGQQVRHTVERVIELMNCVSAGERHLTRHIARGLGKMLDRFNAWEGWYANQQNQHRHLSHENMHSHRKSTSLPVNRDVGSTNDSTDKLTSTTTITNTNSDLHTSPALNNDNNSNHNGLGGSRRSISSGANAMYQGLPPPDLIYTMVGTYGFGLDEQLMDPSIPGFEYMSQ